MEAKQRPKLKERTTTEWMKIFSSLYSKTDSDRTPEQMWIAVMAHASTIGEDIRKYSIESLTTHAAHMFCWLCSFINRCNALPSDDVFSISEPLFGIVSVKYPGACGHCTDAVCSCDPKKIESVKDKAGKYALLLDRRKRDCTSFESYSIESYRTMFYDVFGRKLQIQTLENIGFHFLEEIGEAAVSVRQLSQLRKIASYNNTGIDSAFIKQLCSGESIVNNYLKFGRKDIMLDSKDPAMLKARLVNAKMDLIAEIGDSFSWFCAILNKQHAISEAIFDDPDKHKDIFPSLEQVLNKEYLDESGKALCPSCKSSPCKCAFYNVIC